MNLVILRWSDETSGTARIHAPSDDNSSSPDHPGMQLSNFRNSISTRPAVGSAGMGQVYDPICSLIWRNMAMGSYGQCGCGTWPWLNLRDERKKAAGRFSQETLITNTVTKQEMLRNGIEKQRRHMLERQKALEQNVKSNLKADTATGK